MQRIMLAIVILMSLSGCLSTGEKLEWPDREDEKWEVLGHE